MTMVMTENNEARKASTDHPPYLIEGARSGASKCKTCRRKISKGSLRLGILVDGFYGPGYMWHHLECAARRQMDKVEEAYALEAWKAAREPPENLPSLEDLAKLKEKAEEKRRQRRELPYAEVDPSGRARCKQCGEPIAKGSVRVVLPKETRFGSQVRVGPMTVHPGCVAAAIEQEDVVIEPAALPEALEQNSTGLEPERLREAVEAMSL